MYSISCVSWTKWIHIWQKARPTIKYRHQISFCTHCRFQNNRFIDTIIENGLLAFKHCSLSNYKKKIKRFNRKLRLHIGSYTHLHIEFVSILLFRTFWFWVNSYDNFSSAIICFVQMNVISYFQRKLFLPNRYSKVAEFVQKYEQTFIQFSGKTSFHL